MLLEDDNDDDDETDQETKERRRQQIAEDVERLAYLAAAVASTREAQHIKDCFQRLGITCKVTSVKSL